MCVKMKLVIAINEKAKAFELGLTGLFTGYYPMI
jgi:hypothetical protein